MQWKPVISSHRFDSQANATALSYSFHISVMFQFSFVSCWLGLEKKKKTKKTEFWVIIWCLTGAYQHCCQRHLVSITVLFITDWKHSSVFKSVSRNEKNFVSVQLKFEQKWNNVTRMNDENSFWYFRSKDCSKLKVNWAKTYHLTNSHMQGAQNPAQPHKLWHISEKEHTYSTSDQAPCPTALQAPDQWKHVKGCLLGKLKHSWW